MTTALTHFAAAAGDHNDRALAATPLLAAVLAERLGTGITMIGEPSPARPSNWDIELAAAEPALREMSRHYEKILSAGAVPVTVLSRCAVALATLPAVAKHRPDAVVVWFDAHADLNTPDTTDSGYLGGLALSGPLGLWDSTFGRGLAAANVVLAGTRDFDPFEQNFVDEGSVELVRVGPNMAEELDALVMGRPVYVHIDCDVLNPGIVPTDYTIANGMSLDQLASCVRALARSEIVGLEVGELEVDSENPESDLPARTIVGSLESLLAVLD